MAGKKQFPNGTWQYVFKKKGVLAKPIYLTFASEQEGYEYARRLEALLGRGIVPANTRRLVLFLPSQSWCANTCGMPIRR